MRSRLAAAAVAAVVGTTAIGLHGPAEAGSDGPAAGVLYSGRQGDGRIRMVQIGRLGARPLLLLDVEVECEGFSPEGRGVAVVEEDGRFEVVLGATDTDTSDSVSGTFDDIDGKVRPDAAVLEVDVEVEGEDNAGPTGRCEETQAWRLRGRDDPGAAKIEDAAPIDADAVAVGVAGVFTLRLSDGTASDVTRVDPETLRSTWRTDVSDDAAELAAAGDAVWVLDDVSLTVTRLDGSTGEELAQVALVPPAIAREATSVFTPMTASDVAVWVGADGVEELFRVDAATGTVTARVSTPGGVRALAAAPNGVFASIASPDETSRGGRLVRFDDAGAEVASVALDEVPDALAFDGTTVWVRGPARVVTRHAPDTLAALPGALALAPTSLVEGLMAAPPGVWMSTERGLLAVDDALIRAGTVPVIGAVGASTAAGLEDLWVADSGYLVRVVAT